MASVDPIVMRYLGNAMSAPPTVEGALLFSIAGGAKADGKATDRRAGL